MNRRASDLLSGGNSDVDLLEKFLTQGLLRQIARRTDLVHETDAGSRKPSERTGRRRYWRASDDVWIGRCIEQAKRDAEGRVIAKVRAMIFPVIEKLRREKNPARYAKHLSVLVGHLEDLTSGLTQNLKIDASLSARELRIASMIRHGMTSEEIASHLQISPATVMTHRRNIRRKLKIVGRRDSLQSHLESLEGSLIDTRNVGNKKSRS